MDETLLRATVDTVGPVPGDWLELELLPPTPSEARPTLLEGACTPLLVEPDFLSEWVVDAIPWLALGTVFERSAPFPTGLRFVPVEPGVDDREIPDEVEDPLRDELAELDWPDAPFVNMAVSDPLEFSADEPGDGRNARNNAAAR
jgi:hypothetical protein